MRRLMMLALLAGIPLLAQPPRNFFAWWDTPVARDLNLTDDQQRQIREAVREYRTKLIDLRANVEKAEAEMEETFNDEPFDQRRATEAVDKLVAARGELTRGLSMMGVRLRTTLQPEQWKELQKRRQGMRERMMQRGPMGQRPMDGTGQMKGRPGGPGGPPPPQQQED